MIGTGLGKYTSYRDTILDILGHDGWLIEASGDVEAPTGWFARLDIDPEDVEEVAGKRRRIEAVMGEALPEGFDFDSLVGHYVLTEDSLGFFTAVPFESFGEAWDAFYELDREYGEWASEDED